MNFPSDSVPGAHSFEETCRGFCAALGVPTPAVDAGRDGLQALTVDVGDISLTAIHDVHVDPATLFLVAELETPVGQEVELEGWCAMLEANYWLRAENAPCFSRNPLTGGAIFQWTLPFSQFKAGALHQAIVAMSSLVRRWHTPGCPQTLSPLGTQGFAALA